MTSVEIKAEAREYANKAINLAVSMYNPAAETIAAQAYEDGIKKGLKLHAHDYLVKTANQKIQLTKAKEIVKKSISRLDRSNYRESVVIEKLEQFLKEIEK